MQAFSPDPGGVSPGRPRRLAAESLGCFHESQYHFRLHFVPGVFFLGLEKRPIMGIDTFLYGGRVTLAQVWDSFTWLYICIVAFLVGGLIVASERWHGVFTGDSDMSKPQASHTRSTPRVGGIAVVAGSLAGLLVLGPSNMTLTWLWP